MISNAANCKRGALLAVALLLMAAAGCNTAQQAASDQPETRIEVTNQRLDRVVVYVLRGTRYRLGAVEAANTESFKIPSSLLSGSLTTLRFIAVPLGGSAEVSQEITVSPGDTVGMTVMR